MPDLSDWATNSFGSNPAAFARRGNRQRVLPELRRGRQPAHALGAHVVVDQRTAPVALRRCGRQDFGDIQRLVAPLVGVRVEERGAVHLPWWAVPVQRKGDWLPAGLRPQLFLADIVRPSAARLADAAAHHQEVDDPPIGHVHVVPMVQPGAEDDHGAAVGLFRVRRELASDVDDLVPWDAGDLLGPGGGERRIVVEALGNTGAAKSAVEIVISTQQVEHGGDRHFAVLQRKLPDADTARDHVRMAGSNEIVRCRAAEIRECNLGDRSAGRAECQRGVGAVAASCLEVPLALLAPAETDGAARHHHGAVAVERHRLPGRVVRLSQGVDKIVGAQQPFRYVVLALLHQADQHRQVGIAPRVVIEIRDCAVEMELAQDDVAHRHRQCRVSALLRMHRTAHEPSERWVQGVQVRVPVDNPPPALVELKSACTVWVSIGVSLISADLP